MNSFISVGIDVGSEFSFMSIALPDSSFVGKPFKIVHSDLDSLEAAVSAIKKAEESYSMVSQIFLESTGIYHYPLFCYLSDRNFDVKVINPIISNSTTNFNIRKVHNDKFHGYFMKYYKYYKDISKLSRCFSLKRHFVIFLFIDGFVF